MPLFLCYMPDQPDALERRQGARAAHQALGREAKARGENVFGRAFLSLEEGTMAGSVRLVRYPTIEAVWEAIKRDPYWVNNVWDREKMVVRPLDAAEGDDTLKVTSA